LAVGGLVQQSPSQPVPVGVLVRQTNTPQGGGGSGGRHSRRSTAGQRLNLSNSVGRRARIHTIGDGGAAPTEYIIESINQASISVREPGSKTSVTLLRTDEFTEGDDDSLVIDSFELLDEEEVEQEDVKRWQVILDRFRSFGRPGAGFSTMDDAELVELLENLTVTLDGVEQHWNPESFRKESEDKDEDPDTYLGNTAYQDLWCRALALQILQVGYVFAYSWDDGEVYYDVRVVLNNPQEQRVCFTLASGDGEEDFTNEDIGAQVAVYQIVDGEEDILLGVGTLVEYNADTGDYKVIRPDKKGKPVKPLVSSKKKETQLRRVYDDFILAEDTFGLTDNTVGVNITAAEIAQEKAEEDAEEEEADDSSGAEDDDQIAGHYVWFKMLAGEYRIFYAQATKIPYTYHLVEHLRNGSSRARREFNGILDASVMFADADADIINEDGVSDVYETNGELMVVFDGSTLTQTQYEAMKAASEDREKNLKTQARQEGDDLLPGGTRVYVDGDVRTSDGTDVSVSNARGTTQGEARLVKLDKPDDDDSEAEEDDDETYVYDILLDNGQIIEATADQVSRNSWDPNDDDDDEDVNMQNADQSTDDDDDDGFGND